MAGRVAGHIDVIELEESHAFWVVGTDIDDKLLAVAQSLLDTEEPATSTS